MGKIFRTIVLWAIARWEGCAASPFLDFAMGIHRRGDALLYINPRTNYWGFRSGSGRHPR